ncbi:MAG: FKBP-type peptidyl-prolyl cis-trans isomerase [Thermoplasmata archaeon]
MGSDSEKKEPRDLRRVITAVIMAAILVAVVAIGYVLYLNSKSSRVAASRAIVAGDTVTMDYIGRLANGWVFDTSNLTVAHDDVNYPKSLTFKLRENGSYKEFEMTAGNYRTGGTIKGFALGVIGLHVGERQVIEVAPDEGYPVRPEMIQTINISQETNVIEVMTEDQFRDVYDEEPIPTHTYTHFFWGWDVVVVERIGGKVTLRNEPYVGQVVSPYGDPQDPKTPAGWYCLVESYNPTAYSGMGSITVRHLITSDDVYRLKGTDYDGKEFVLSAFNSTAGTFQIHKSDPDTGYNGEISGRTLYFEVTILEVKSGEG